MIRAFFIVFACLALGELVVKLLGLRLPPSIIGLLTLFLLLHSGVVREEWIKPLADFLMQYMLLLLVPPCVAVMNYYGLIAKDFWAILGASVLSTALVLLVTGKVHEVARHVQRRSKAG